jgi:hypothetical protein
MIMAATFETFTATPVAVVTLVDQFVQLRGSSGQFPPPIGPVIFQLIASLPAAGLVILNPPIVLAAQTNGRGIFLFAGEGTIQSSPLLRIPAGRYRLLVASDYYQPATLDLDWPPDLAAPPLIPLKPASAYPFPDLTMASNQLTLLNGNLYQAGGDRQPIANAMVNITSPVNAWPFASCITDANGGWVLAIPIGSGAPVFDAILRFTLPDGTFFDVPAVPVQTGAANSLPQTAMRGSVFTTTGAPLAGAVVTVAGVAGTSASGRDGGWKFYMSLVQPDVAALVTATSLNGHNQSQNVQIHNRETILVPAFQIASD